MAFSLYKVLKGLLIREENTLTPRQVQILPGGTSSTTTTIQANQTADITLNLPSDPTTIIGDDTTNALTNKTFDVDATGNVLSNVADANIKSGAAIDASKLADGSVSNAELQFINSLTSNAQVQLDSKASSASLTAHTGASSGVHGITGSVVGTSDTQSLTNKTIDADLNTISNIDNADIKALAGIDASKLADGSVSNAELQFINSLTSNAQTQLDNKASKALDNLASTAINVSLLPATDNTISAGDATHRLSEVWTNTLKNSADLVVTAGTGGANKVELNALTSKLSKSSTTDPSGVARDVYYNSALNKYRFHDGTAWKDLGSGSGTGSKNYLTEYLNNPGNGDFEKGTTAGFSLVTTSQVNSFPSGTPTAGAASFTTFQVVNNSTTLDGTYSLTLTATTGVAFQGVISDQFMIDRADHAKVLKYSFDYMPGVTNDQSNLWAVAIYDVDNNVWIQPTNNKPIKTSYNIPGKAEGSFQTSYNGTLYRIFIYCTLASSAMNLSLDNIFVGPSEVVSSSSKVVARATQNNGQVITNTTLDFNALTFDSAGSFNLSTNEYIIPVSGTYEVSAQILTDFAPWATADFLQLELYKNGTLYSRLGADVIDIAVTKSMAANGSDEISCNAGDLITLKGVTNRSGGISLVTDNTFNYVNISLVSSNQDVYGLSYVPKVVVGLSTNQTINTGGGFQKIAFNSILTGQTNVASWFDTTNYRFIPKQVGMYLVNASVFINGSNNRYSINLYKNGTIIAQGGSGGITADMGADTTYLVEMNGDTDYLEVFVENFSTVNTTVIDDDSATFFQVLYCSNITNSTNSDLSVNMRATIASGTISNADNVIVYTTKDYDSHNKYNTSTGEYTIPVSGKYEINAKYIAGGVYTSGNALSLRIKKNGTIITDEFFRSITFTGSQMISSSSVLNLKANDIITISSYSEATTPTLPADGQYDIFEIMRVGN
jgi:hypothetical protein